LAIGVSEKSPTPLKSIETLRSFRFASSLARSAEKTEARNTASDLNSNGEVARFSEAIAKMACATFAGSPRTMSAFELIARIARRVVSSSSVQEAESLCKLSDLVTTELREVSLGPRC